MLVSVRVRAGARKESVEKTGDNRYRIAVREEAEGNRANDRVRTLIALEYAVPTTRVRIVKGHHSPGKVMEIVG